MCSIQLNSAVFLADITSRCSFDEHLFVLDESGREVIGEREYKEHQSEEEQEEQEEQVGKRSKRSKRSTSIIHLGSGGRVLLGVQHLAS